MKRLALFAATLALVLSPLGARAQFIPLTGSNIQDVSGNPLQSGTICFTPVNNNGSPIGFRAGGGGQVPSFQKCVAVTNGAFTTNIADTANTYPANVCLYTSVNVPAASSPTGAAASYVISSCLQPSETITASNSFWCSATTGCNLDNYEPQYAPGVVATAPNITSITATTLGSGAPATAVLGGSYPNYTITLGIPQGIQGGPGTAGAQGPPVTFRGTYSSSTAYNYGDAVAYTVGSTTTEYVSLVPGTGTNTNNAPPSSPSQWGVAATGNAYPGVSSDGSNGLIINGANTFADSTSVATAPKMGNLSVLGDSNSAGFQRPMTCGPFGTGNCGYAWLIGYHLGPNANFNDYAISGAQAEDLSSLQCMPQAQSYFGSAAQSLIMVGTNNAQYAGSTTAAQNNYNHSLLACAAFRAIPREYTIYPGSNTTQVSTASGTFTADSTYQASMGLTTLTGGTITLNTFQASNYLVLAWYAKDGDTASAALSCDAGAVTDTLNASGYQTIATHNGVTSTVFGTLYTFPTNATHSCTLTVTASTGNPFTLEYAGTPPPSTPTAYGVPMPAPPIVYIAGVAQEQSDANSAATALYNGLANSMATTLHAAGLKVSFLNTRAVINPTSDYPTTATVTLANGEVCTQNASSVLHWSSGSASCGDQKLASYFIGQMGLAAPGLTLAKNTPINNFNNGGQELDTTGVITLTYTSPRIIHANTSGGVITYNLPACHAISGTNNPVPEFDIYMDYSASNYIQIRPGDTVNDAINGIFNTTTKFLTTQYSRVHAICNPSAPTNTAGGYQTWTATVEYYNPQSLPVNNLNVLNPQLVTSGQTVTLALGSSMFVDVDTTTGNAKVSLPTCHGAISPAGNIWFIRKVSTDSNSALVAVNSPTVDNLNGVYNPPNTALTKQNQAVLVTCNPSAEADSANGGYFSYQAISTANNVIAGADISVTPSANNTIQTIALSIPQSTVSGLPACSSGNKGLRYDVTDGSSPTFLGTLTGGGTTYTPAVCNGTNWVSY